MNHRLPDLRLLRAFGNESVLLEKVAGAESLAARFAVGLMEANRSLDTRRREEELRAHAARMNMAFRMLEDRAMQPVREGAAHTRMPLILMALSANRGRGGMGIGAPLPGVPRELLGEDVPLGMDEGMVRMASAIGQDLAGYAFDKEAGIGQVLGNLGKGLGTGLKSSVGGFGANSRFLGAAKSMGVSPVQKPGALGQAFSSAKGSLKANLTSGGRLQAKFDAVSPKPPPLPNQPLTRGSFRQGATTRMLNEGKAIDAARVTNPTAVGQSPYRNPVTPGAPKGQVAPVGGGTSTPTGGGEDGGFDLQKAWERTGLSNGAWKTKLPMLAAGAIGAYGLYAGAKKGLEVLGREPEPARYNEGGAIPAYGVNQYGVPDRSTSFM